MSRRPAPAPRAVKHLVPFSCDRGMLEADPVARDPTRPHKPAPQQWQLLTPERHPSPHQHKRKKKSPTQARLSAPPRPSARATAATVRSTGKEGTSFLGTSAQHNRTGAGELKQEKPGGDCYRPFSVFDRTIKPAGFELQLDSAYDSSGSFGNSFLPITPIWLLDEPP